MKGNGKSTIRLSGRLAPQLAITALVALGILVFAAPAAFAAEGERVIEPELSLIGGCKAEGPPDNVEDPGCPSNPPPGPHPASTFAFPYAVATDLHGNIYVSNFGSASDGSKGRIDVFCSDGAYISSLPVDSGPRAVAIDSEGNLYVFHNEGDVFYVAPEAPYQPQPAACEIEYDKDEGVRVPVADTAAENGGLAINRDNDHLFGNFGSQQVREYKSAAEGSELIRSFNSTSWSSGVAMAIDSQRDRMYASAGPTEERIDIYDLNTLEGTPPEDRYAVVGSIVDSEVPSGELGTGLSVAADEGTGNVFLLDGENCRLYEFDEDGDYLQSISAGFLECVPGLEIGVDNSLTSPNGKPSEEEGKGRFLYVPSNRTGIGHSYAFFIKNIDPPEVLSTAVANVSEDEAELRAQIKTNNLPTTYTFEVKAQGAAGWTTPAGGGTLPASSAVQGASAVATGLSPGRSYAFRVVATNEEGADDGEGSFSTYPSVPTETSLCPNALLRTGPSALLPDCRAYELVTPADTNARAPIGVRRAGPVFTTRQVNPAGDKIPFRVEGGSLPGLGGTGTLLGDPYLATRTSGGWSTAYAGPSGEETTQPSPGGSSPDQEHSFWLAEGKGSAVLDPEGTAYVRYPDGHSELLGQGSLGIDPQSRGQLISDGGGHVVFWTGAFASASTAVQLEPKAAPDGTRAIYDRTPDGTTHVVSLKPDGGSFGAGENANYQGASLDGKGIAFAVGGALYLRYDNEETFAIGAGVEAAGVAEGGERLFYVDGVGDLKAFDVAEGEVDFTTGVGDVIPVTVSADGSSAYFVSETVIAGAGANPEGKPAQAGGQNLYRSVEGQIAFVATVTERDVEGVAVGGGELTDGLGLWAASTQVGNLGWVPARSTPDGSVFLFKSRAELTGYDPEGHAQIYRYAAGELQCLSCNPTGAAAGSDATLQSEYREGSEFFSTFGWPENLRADGRRAFFESSEALVAGDTDGLRDVYEWEDQGVGSCKRPGGCVYLISSPQSLREEYLWAVSPSGNDVFFLSSELLVGSDADETPSIYDARVGGGFAEAAPPNCEGGEGCRPQLSPPPLLPGIRTPVEGPGDQAKSTKPRRCAKNKRKVKRAGKVRCVKKKKRRNRAKGKKSRAAAGKKGGRR